jgi:hypothetical protein
MGQSTDGILFYGIAYDDDLELPWEAEEFEGEELDWEDWYAVQAGVERPTIPYEESEKVHEIYWDQKRNALEDQPIEIGTHCSCEYPMVYIAPKAINLSASRGYPLELDLVNLQSRVTPEVDAQIKTFCELMGLPYSKPKWWLASLWC